MIRLARRWSVWGRPAAVGALLALAPLPGRAGDDLAMRLREFRAAPAGAVAENLHGAAAPTAPRARLLPPEPRHGYAAWAAEVFSADELADARVSAPEAVGAGDGLTNLEKYALGLDPHAAAIPEALPESGQLDEHWFLWYRRPSDTDDVIYRVEASTDGVNWSSAGVTQEPILANDLAQSWQAHYQAAAGQVVLLRLVVALR